MKYIYTYYLFLTLVCCTSEPNRKVQQKAPDPVEIAPKGKPTFWNEVCKLNKFIYMYDCNNTNCFQIELLNDPFKEYVVITLDISDPTKDIIYYNRFQPSESLEADNQKNKLFTDVITIINPGTKEMMYLFFKKTSKIIIKPKNRDINNFLTSTIWRLPTNDDDEYRGIIDPEIWNIKGRLEGKEIILRRCLFNGSLYYSNVQNILDICKIKDYKYKMR